MDNKENLCGIINVLKPPFMTSSDAVSKIRGIIKEKRVGHLGTLDPYASGVLPIAVGKATRLFDFFLEKKKTYRAFFDFSCETDTLDSAGVINAVSSKIVTKEEISASCKRLIGKQMQVPPQYSSKSVDGKRAYDYARNDITVELKPCEIEIYSIDLVEELGKNKYCFDISCSSGTYIRSIVRDMAKIMGTYGFMSALIRLQSGNYEIENALRFDEIEKMGKGAIIPVETACGYLERIDFDDDYHFMHLVNGIKQETNVKNGIYRLYHHNLFIGISIVENGELSVKLNFTT